MRFYCCFAFLLTLIGCATEPSGSTGQVSISSNRYPASVASPSVALAKPHEPDDEDQDRFRGVELRQHPEARQNHESDPNFHPPADLHGMFASRATPDLKALLARHRELLEKRYGIRDFRIRTPTETEVPDVSGQRLFDEFMEAERELMRRWKAGDRAARLPEFTQ